MGDGLFGGEGDDWLDAGSAIETALNGFCEGGNDFNAYVTTVNIAQLGDIAQGGANNCCIWTSMAAVSRTGVDLASRISYVGNG